MDVQLSEEQELLRESAREFLERECPVAVVRAVSDDPTGRNDELWAKLAGLGWAGLLIPEAYGGAGLGAVELAVLFEQAGRVLLPGPLFSHVSLGGVAVELAGSEAQKRRLLPALAAGSSRITLAPLEEGGGWGADDAQLAARPVAGGYRLTGAKVHVPEAQQADWLLVPARCQRSGADDCLVFCLVDSAAAGVEIRSFAFVDGSRKMCEVRLSDVAVASDDVLWDGEPGGAGVAQAFERVLDLARVALAAELTGAAERVLELSVDYARTREQFGRKIGGFQAIAHKCSDMFVRVESARSAVYYAAWTLAAGEPNGHSSACLAKAYCSEAAAQVAGDGIQIHGGQGFTWEQDLHLYFRRAKASEHFLGDGCWNRELAARALLD